MTPIANVLCPRASIHDESGSDVDANGDYYPGAHARMNPERVALIEASGDVSVTYRELDDTAWRAARFYREHGLRSGDVVVLCLDNSAAFVALLWGAHYAGLRYVPMSPSSSADEISYVARSSEAKLVLTRESTADRVGFARFELDHDVVALPIATDWPSTTEFLSVFPAQPLDDAVAGACMLYSSGTTGRPKGIRNELSGHPLGGVAGQLAPLLQGLFGFTAESVYLSPAPLYHAAPFRYVMAVGEIGGTAVVMPRFDAAEALRSIGRHHVTHTQMVPTMFSRILSLPEAQRTAADVSSLQYVIHAGAPCPVSVKRAMLDWLGPIVHEYYSGSEGVGFVYCSPEDWLAHPGTVGRSLRGPAHILDDDDHELLVGQTGNVYFENPSAFEYLGDPEKTNDAFSLQGWGTFGDIGHLDDEGFLYLSDRRGEMIISGGVNVYPAEVEATLIGHPAVSDVAVIGLPDEDFGERVHAVVELHPGYDGADGLADELLSYCGELLSKPKCPKGFDFVERLPRTETGKMLRRVVRDEYRKQFASQPDYR